MAKASILWLVGEYCSLVPKIAPDVLRKAAKDFVTAVGGEREGGGGGGGGVLWLAMLAAALTTADPAFLEASLSLGEVWEGGREELVKVFYPGHSGGHCEAADGELGGQAVRGEPAPDPSALPVRAQPRKV